MPQSSTLYIELDVHQETITVASVAKGHDAEVIDLATHSNAKAHRRCQASGAAPCWAQHCSERKILAADR
jgi:ribulose 1,5-bisphosphate synthetase/thiazole synthase